MGIKIVAFDVWSEGSFVGIRSSEGKLCVSESPAVLLEFLRYCSKSVVRIFWDLDDSLAPVLKTLSLPILERLAAFDGHLSVSGHEIYYLPDRMFRVGRSRYYSIRQFWPTSEPVPATLEEAQQKADELAETLSDCGMPDFTRLTSPIAVFEETELGKQTYAGIPKGYEILPSCFAAIEYASKCDKREWISAYQIGHWGEGEIFDYDCNAMYPSAASGLLNLPEMELWKSTTYGSRESGAYYGFLRGHLYLDPSADYIHCSPIMTDLDRLPGNPVGDFGDNYYLTLDELRLIERNNWGEFQMTDGWFLKPYGGVRPTTPLLPIMGYLYSKRYRSELASSVMKGVANQMIGKLIETRVDGDYGVLRNDIYHALILSQARVKVAEFLIQNEIQANELVTVQTDGVRLTRYTPVRGSGMGSWRCNGSQPTIVASPYKVYCQDRKPGHLTYDHIVEMVREHPQYKYYDRTIKYRTTLRQAIQQGDISRVGELDDLPAHLDLVALTREQNRVFNKMPKTGQALLSGKYQSEAVIL